MRSIVIILSAGLLGMAMAPAWADQHEATAEMSPEEAAMMEAWQASMTPGESHAFLAGLAGEYTATVRSYEDPSGEPEVSESQVTRAMELDGRVLREEWTGTVMGMPFHGVGRTGYDNVSARYWTTWTDNLSTGLFVAYGQRDANTGVMEFTGTMPDPMTGEMVATRSVAVHGEDGAEQMTMYRDMGGQEVKTMEFEIRRR